MGLKYHASQECYVGEVLHYLLVHLLPFALLNSVSQVGDNAVRDDDDGSSHL